jgi:hypothetical protein
MKKLIFTLIFLSLISVVFGQTADLNGHTFDRVYDYSLTPDAKHLLKIQPLSKSAFVISSVLMFKLGKIAVEQNTNKLVKQEYAQNVKKRNMQQQKVKDLEKDLVQNKMVKDSSNANALNMEHATLTRLNGSVEESSKLSFKDHLSFNVALNLVNISQDVSFNKNIDGGLGIGYLFGPNWQLALFYDISKVSQLRDYIVSSYQGKSIIGGDGKNLSSLDTKDNSLFYNKTVTGFSLKLVFSIGSKKVPQGTAE